MATVGLGVSPTPEVVPVKSFSWLLDCALYKDTVFNKKKCVELLDIQKIVGFIQAEMGISYIGINRYNGVATQYKTELEQIIKFKERYNEKLKSFSVSHHLAKHKRGRVQPSNYLSASIFHRPTRHSLCRELYVDIDMINAQPTIINEISKLNGIHNQYLIKYVANPAKYRKKVMEHHNCSKDVAKTLFIVLMFGGCYKSWIKDNNINHNDTAFLQIAVEIEKEMRTIIEIVYSNNPQIKKDVLKQDPKRWDNENDAKRGVMGLWSQSVERFVQETAIMFLVKTRNIPLEQIIPCQDGFMILQQYNYPTIIQDIQKEVADKCALNIGFLIKPFDEAIDIPTCSDYKVFDDWVDDISVKKLADRFINHFSNYIIKNNDNIYIYWGEKKDNLGNYTDGRWYDETNKDKRYKLTKYISEDLYNLVCEELENVKYLEEKEISKLMKLLRDNTSKGGAMNDVIRHIVPNAKSSTVEFNGNPYLLGFDNGVFDLQADEFRNYRYDDYITMTTKYNYIQVDYDLLENNTLKEELATIIDTIHPDPEHRLLYLQILASGLDGRAYQKLFLYNGQGGNGKGFTGSMMDTTLGDYYHQPSNGILKDVEKSNSPSPDMFNLKGKRYINFKEVAGSVRVAMLRNLTGGGKFSGRLLNQNPETFTMSATFVMEFNNPPELDGKPQRADYRRLVDLLFPVNFTDNESLVGKEIGGVLYKKANTYYETQEFIQKMRPIFLDLLIGVYRAYKTKDGINFTIPQSIRDRTDKFIENQNLFQKVFNDLWKRVEVIPDDENDIKRKTQKVKDIWDSITYSDDYKRLSYRDKRQYGRDEFYKWIEEQIKIQGNSKTGKIVIGLIRKEDDDDLPDDDDDADTEVN